MLLRAVTRLGLLFLLGTGAASGQSRITGDPAPEPSLDHLEQLTNCRAGIVDPHARSEDRRRWIDTLLAFDTPSAKALVVELLQLSENPTAQQALCEVIGERARRNPEWLDPAFLEPLIELLGAEIGDLRAAAARALADFPGEEVPAKLGAFAAQDEVPLPKRLAAIDALAAKVDRREVVRELMTLLDAAVPEITARVTTALEPASREMALISTVPLKTSGTSSSKRRRSRSGWERETMTRGPLLVRATCSNITLRRWPMR